MSPSIGTPPRLSQAPSLHDHRLTMPTIIQNINEKWDSLPLNEGFSNLFASIFDRILCFSTTNL